MSMLDRWIVASRNTPVLDDTTLAELQKLGANVGGGWFEIHQHIHVNVENKDRIEELLRSKGLTVSSATDPSVRHPDSGRFKAVK